MVILLGKCRQLLALYPTVKIWVAFGTGKSFTYHFINAMYEMVGKDRSLTLPVFHSFTGCDTTSAFFGRSKKSAWETWNSFPDVTQAFIYIALHPFADVDFDDEHFKLLERFTVILYDKTSDSEHVNETREDLFCQKSRTMEKLPLTRDALLQHSKRAAYQAGVWSISDRSEHKCPTPEGWGWTLKGQSLSWKPVWSMLPIASKACSELVKCNCKSQIGCVGRRACRKAGCSCTELCTFHCLKMA